MLEFWDHHHCLCTCVHIHCTCATSFHHMPPPKGHVVHSDEKTRKEKHKDKNWKQPLDFDSPHSQRLLSCVYLEASFLSFFFFTIEVRSMSFFHYLSSHIVQSVYSASQASQVNIIIIIKTSKINFCITCAWLSKTLIPLCMSVKQFFNAEYEA